mmetsp:Transcript_9160/g.25680  ORF Transcript_9160/g.25680 Transcript_9160/m.25680 type:complete len:223 (+) Transcript_9160:22-690(+)
MCVNAVFPARYDPHHYRSLLSTFTLLFRILLHHRYILSTFTLLFPCSAAVPVVALGDILLTIKTLPWTCLLTPPRRHCIVVLFCFLHRSLVTLFPLPYCTFLCVILVPTPLRFVTILVLIPRPNVQYPRHHSTPIIRVFFSPGRYVLLNATSDSSFRLAVLALRVAARHDHRDSMLLLRKFVAFFSSSILGVRPTITRAIVGWVSARRTCDTQPANIQTRWR